jgi:hypothetical protein
MSVFSVVAVSAFLVAGWSRSQSIFEKSSYTFRHALANLNKGTFLWFCATNRSVVKTENE